VKNHFPLLDPLRFGTALGVAIFHQMFWSWAWVSIGVPGFERYVAAAGAELIDVEDGLVELRVPNADRGAFRDRAEIRIAFTLDALGNLGYREQVHASLAWLLAATEASHPRLGPFYTLDGKVTDNVECLELEGYRGSRPVRSGNGASGQVQLGSYGDLLDPGHVPFIYNLPPTLDNLRVLFNDTLFVRWAGNTIFIGVLVVLITLLIAVPAGYSLARLTGAIGEQLGVAMFLTYLVPPTILFIPLSRVVSILHLQDSPFALVLVYPSFTIPFCTWLMMGFFKAIPKDIEEAAMVDGMSRLGAFTHVILPMSVAGLLTVVIFTFTLVMQEFVYGLTFINSGRNFTVSVGVPSFLVRGDVYFWGSLMGACFIASVPIAFLYNLFVDRFIAGFTVGAVKG